MSDSTSWAAIAASSTEPRSALVGLVGELEFARKERDRLKAEFSETNAHIKDAIRDAEATYYAVYRDAKARFDWAGAETRYWQAVSAVDRAHGALIRAIEDASKTPKENP